MKRTTRLWKSWFEGAGPFPVEILSLLALHPEDKEQAIKLWRAMIQLPDENEANVVLYSLYEFDTDAELYAAADRVLAAAGWKRMALTGGRILEFKS